MYGQIHVCIRSLVLEKFGEEAWKKILNEAGYDDTEKFLVFHHYGDDVTINIVKAASTVLGVEIAVVLELFGEYFFTYCLTHGYDKMLRTLGENFVSFIQNLDSLHALLQITYSDIDAPSFRCEELGSGIVKLHYYSSREGLYPIVVGLVRAVGKELYHSTCTAEVLEISKVTVGNGKVRHHVSFKITITDENKADDNKTTINKEEDMIIENYVPKENIISPQNFCSLFPFHILFDSNLVIQQCGMNIQKMAFLNKFQGVKLTEYFRLIAPIMPLTFDYILRFINASYILEVLDDDSPTPSPMKSKRKTKLVLKGQMMWLKDTNHIIFIGSPRLSNLNELMEKNLYLSDIPLYDVTRELVLLNQQRIAEIEISKKLDETTAELKRTAIALDQEKQKTDQLLYQMLPIKVADSLRDGVRVEAEKFDEVTILFSDIVTFTNIAAAVKPMQIVNMLNTLYVKFDTCTHIHDVYKVETIGDAYMVVGGVPDHQPKHAQQVASFALDMVDVAAEVKSPATGLPLQIRVGIHTGSVVAGVVGERMPRYCLFGDTVNTASRMESHGIPGRIHCSPFCYNAIKHNPEFIFEERGEIDVKGKGKMVTHFLVNKKDRPKYVSPEVENGEPHYDFAAPSGFNLTMKSTINVKTETENTSSAQNGSAGTSGKNTSSKEATRRNNSATARDKSQSSTCVVL